MKLFALFFEPRSAISLMRLVLLWQCWTAMWSAFTGGKMPGSFLTTPSALISPCLILDMSWAKPSPYPQESESPGGVRGGEKCVR